MFTSGLYSKTVVTSVIGSSHHGHFGASFFSLFIIMSPPRLRAVFVFGKCHDHTVLRTHWCSGPTTSRTAPVPSSTITVSTSGAASGSQVAPHLVQVVSIVTPPPGAAAWRR